MLPTARRRPEPQKNNNHGVRSQNAPLALAARRHRLSAGERAPFNDNRRRKRDAKRPAASVQLAIGMFVAADRRPARALIVATENQLRRARSKTQKRARASSWRIVGNTRRRRGGATLTSGMKSMRRALPSFMNQKRQKLLYSCRNGDKRLQSSSVLLVGFCGSQLKMPLSTGRQQLRAAVFCSTAAAKEERQAAAIPICQTFARISRSCFAVCFVLR